MPAPTLEIKDAYGNWIDQSAYLLMKNGVSAKRGRASQWDTSSTGSMSFVLDNSTNRFTPGANYYLFKNAEVRLKISGYQVWTGFVDTISNPLERGSQQTVAVTCSDRFKFYAKQLLSSYGVEVSDYNLRTQASATAGATYPLSAPKTGVGSFWTAHRQPSASPIRIYGGNGGSHAFVSDGPAFAPGSIQLLTDDSSQAPVLEHPTSFDPSTTKAAIALWFRVETKSPNAMYLFQLFRTSGGTGSFTGYIDPATSSKIRFAGSGDTTGTITHTSAKTGLDDGLWHHLVVYVDQTATATTLRVFIDSIIDSTYTATAKVNIGSSNRRMVFGGVRNTSWTNNVYCLPGMMNCVSVFTYSSALSDSYATGVYTAGTDGDNGASLASRTSKLAGFVSQTAPSVANSSGFTVSGQDTAGKSYLTAIQDIAESDQAVFYLDRLGDPKFRSSGARSSGASVSLTVDADKDLSNDLVIVVDDAQFANTITASGPVGEYTTVDSTSVTNLGSIVDRFECLASTESLLQSSAATRLSARLNENPRLGRVVVDLLTSPSSIAATTVQLVPLDRVRVSNLPTSWTPTGTSTFDGFVEGWDLAISDQSYTVSFDLSPIP